VSLADLLGLDTNCFIYEFDAVGPRTDYLHREVFVPMRDGLQRAVVSSLAISELLVPRFRIGDQNGARAMENRTYALPNLAVLPVERATAVRAAELRAEYGLRLVDAIHLATAILAGADGFLTNDRQFLRAADALPIFVIDDLISDASR
jgi:predicted nucleic acid-binding protein